MQSCLQNVESKEFRIPADKKSKSEVYQRHDKYERGTKCVYVWTMKRKKSIRRPSHLYQHVFCIRKRNLILTWFLSWWWNIRHFFPHQNAYDIDCLSQAALDVVERLFVAHKLAIYHVRFYRIRWFECATWDRSANGTHTHTEQRKKYERNVANRLKFAESSCIWLSRDENCSNLMIECDCLCMYTCGLVCESELLISPYRIMCDMNI